MTLYQALLIKKLIDKVVAIDDEDAINMSRILAKKYGLGVGISSGANLIAAIITAKNKDNVVTIFADDLKKSRRQFYLRKGMI